MLVPSLQTASINCIVKEVWTNSKAPSVLLKLAVAEIEILTLDKLDEQSMYHQVVEAVLKNILALHLPLKIKVKIAIAYIKLKEDITNTVLRLIEYLIDDTKENIAYCIAKVCVNNGKVDRGATVLKILHDSYFNVDFDMMSISNYCRLSRKKLRDVCESLVKCVSKKEIKMRIKTKYCRMSELFMDTFRLWKICSCKANNMPYTLLRYFTFDDSLIFAHVAENASVDIVKFMYTRIDKPSKLLIVSKALLCALLSDQRNEENILFLFQKLSRRKLFRIFLRFHENIFKKLFLSFHGDICLDVFKKLCEHRKYVTCKRILYNTVKLLHSSKCQYDCGDIVYAHSKEIFLKMWHTAPDNVKSKLGKQFHQMLDMLIDKDDFHFISILINDSAFTKDQKYQHIVHIISKLILESNSVKLEALERDCLSADIACIKENMTIDLLKMILTTKCESYAFEALSVFFESQCDIKEELLNNKTFAVTVISTIAQSDEQIDNIQNFLKWIFNDNEQEIECFIQIHLVSDLWLLDICKRYLLETSSQLICPKPTLLDCFDLKEEDIEKIKIHIRKDRELINRLCEYFTAPQLCHQVSNLLECLFNDGEEKEKQQLLINYFLSETGLTRIYQLFESNYYNEMLYQKYGFSDTIKHYCDLLRNYWLSSHQDLNILNEAIRDHWYPDELRRTQVYASKVLLLPCESPKDHATITNCNMRIFQCILELDLENFERVKEELEFSNCSITEHCRKFEDWVQWECYD